MDGDCRTNALWLVQPNNKNQINNIATARSLVTSSSDQLVPVRVFNPFNYAQVIEQGAVVGQLQEICEVVNCDVPTRKSEKPTNGLKN